MFFLIKDIKALRHKAPISGDFSFKNFIILLRYEAIGAVFYQLFLQKEKREPSVQQHFSYCPARKGRNLHTSHGKLVIVPFLAILSGVEMMDLKFVAIYMLWSGLV